jgi:2,5-diketo-D-gluconate reductase A
MANVPTVKLRNGVEMPQLGFGVFQIPADQTEQCVTDALKAGYRHIDTAVSYGNEEAVGNAIKKSSIPREGIFVTSKVWIADATYEGAKRSLRNSLKRLRLDYLDLYLLHQPYNDIFGAWRALEELYEVGKIKAIGVSNFTAAKLANFVLGDTKTKPMVNQIEIHPFNQQPEALEIMEEYGIQPEGWAPFAEGQHNIFSNEALTTIAEHHGKTVGQVILRWNIQRGVVAIPKSVRPERMAENFDIFNFELPQEDMYKIATLDQKLSTVNHEDPKFVKYLYGRNA